MKVYVSFFKPIFDFVLAFVVFFVLSPVFIVVLILLSIANQGKPFFFQLRPGKNGKIFKIIKFKTMTDKCDSSGQLLPDSKRLTKVGRFIRKTSLDEIPQLINVLKGDMSFIGPRPLLVDYLTLYNDTQRRRHEVKPGITGWAQVNGRNAISWEDKFTLDLFYVDNLTLFLDSKIIILTIIKVLKSEGINNSDNVTMTKFNGKN